MYVQKLQVDVVVDGSRKPCPLEWLDAFCMRNFTGSGAFDDTLPTGDGAIEAGLRVDPQLFATALGQWLTQRGKAGAKQVLVEVRLRPV
jgi:hypothetical protein